MHREQGRRRRLRSPVAPKAPSAPPQGVHSHGMEISPARMKRPPRKARSGHPAVSRWAGAAVAAVLLISAGYVAGATSRSGAHVPAEGSADVGFLRDMMVHHSQAVTLAIIVLPRATTRPVREIAEETAIDQQREIGLMAGWLQQWGL